MKKTISKSILLLFFGFILSSCNKTLPPGEYDSSEVGKVKKVIPGTIISKRAVNLHSNKNNLGENDYNQSHGMEYVIKLNSGSIVSVVQAEDLKLKNKQKILVIYGKHTRVVPNKGSDQF